MSDGHSPSHPPQNREVTELLLGKALLVYWCPGKPLEDSFQEKSETHFLSIHLANSTLGQIGGRQARGVQGKQDRLSACPEEVYSLAQKIQ